MAENGTRLGDVTTDLVVFHDAARGKSKQKAAPVLGASRGPSLAIAEKCCAGGCWAIETSRGHSRCNPCSGLGISIPEAGEPRGHLAALAAPCGEAACTLPVHWWVMRRRRDPSYDLFALLRAVKYSMYLRGGIPSTRVKSVVKLLGLL